jgi:hypothetical protein
MDRRGVGDHFSVGIALVNSARDAAMTNQADQGTTSAIASSAWTKLSDQVEFREATNHLSMAPRHNRWLIAAGVCQGVPLALLFWRRFRAWPWKR